MKKLILSNLLTLLISSALTVFVLVNIQDSRTGEYVFRNPRNLDWAVAEKIPTEYLDSDTILRLVSEYRVSKGLSTMTKNDLLCEVASERTQHIVSTGDWSHDGFLKNKDKYQTRLQYTDLGENLAKDYFSDSEVVQKWINSPSHRAVLQTPSYTDGCVSVNGTVVALITASFP